MKKLLQEYNAMLVKEGHKSHSEALHYSVLFRKFSELISEMGYVKFKIKPCGLNRYIDSSYIYPETGEVHLYYKTDRDGEHDHNSATISSDFKEVINFSCYAQYRDAFLSIVKVVHEYFDTFDKIVNIAEYDRLDRSAILPILEKYNVPNEESIIRFPGISRGELCSEYVPISAWKKLKDVKPGNTLILKGIRKNFTEKSYTVLQVDHNGTIAVRDNESNEILFLQDEWEISDAYDALYECNQAFYKGWRGRTKRVKDIF